MEKSNSSAQNVRQPFFYDITLRDGNQALKRPWNLEQKEQVFRQLITLGVQGIEVGFSGASDMDFAACEHLAKLAPDHVVISGLARAVEHDIVKVWESVRYAKKPRIHTFIALSPFAMENVLRMPPEAVQRKAVEAVALCKKVMGGTGDIQFSAEHFGDCIDNLDFAIDTFKKVVEAGATTINLPNTVERYRPRIFANMVEKVSKALPSHVTVAVHCHNDLGMATATTVEGFFAGATQLETALNGLGERAGNTNMYEVACALHNCGVSMPINMNAIYETALQVADWSQVPIYEKAPLIGKDVVAHRSGIHQDGAAKTKGMKKGAYRAIDMALIGRDEDDRLAFTSQSGKTAVLEIIKEAGLPITLDEAARLQPVLKRRSEQSASGELSLEEILQTYEQEIFNVSGPLVFKDVRTGPFKDEFAFEVSMNDKDHHLIGKGNGPIDACMKAIASVGLHFHLMEYNQMALDTEHLEFAAHAVTEIKLQKRDSESGNPIGPIAIGRAKDTDTMRANIKALVNGMNLLLK